jgi:hypothetical protein
MKEDDFQAREVRVIAIDKDGYQWEIECSRVVATLPQGQTASIGLQDE